MARMEIRAPEDAMERWRVAAEADGRSLSSWVRARLDEASGGGVDLERTVPRADVVDRERARAERLPAGATELVHLVDARTEPKVGPSAASVEPGSLVGAVGDRSLPKRSLKRKERCEHRLEPTQFCKVCDA